MKPFDIAGKTALVTGANRGIGKVMTETLLANGTRKVYAAVRRPSSAEALVAEHGDNVEVVEFDSCKSDLIRAAAAKASDTQLVINNAGLMRIATPLADDAMEALREEIDVNVGGLIRTAQAFAPVLKANGGGAFVQLNSVASMKCFPDFTTYCASKAASYAVTQALRTQLEDQGTAVFSVHPGPIDTDMADNAGMAEMAEPPSVVAEALLDAFKTGSFHVWPDSMARQIGDAYADFATNIVEADLMEGSEKQQG